MMSVYWIMFEALNAIHSIFRWLIKSLVVKNAALFSIRRVVEYYLMNNYFVNYSVVWIYRHGASVVWFKIASDCVWNVNWD